MPGFCPRALGQPKARSPGPGSAGQRGQRTAQPDPRQTWTCCGCGSRSTCAVSPANGSTGSRRGACGSPRRRQSAHTTSWPTAAWRTPRRRSIGFLARHGRPPLLLDVAVTLPRVGALQFLEVLLFRRIPVELEDADRRQARNECVVRHGLGQLLGRAPCDPAAQAKPTIIVRTIDATHSQKVIAFVGCAFLHRSPY